MISVAQMRAFAPACDAEAMAPALAAAALEFGIGTPLRLAHWLGQLHVESAGFTRLAENLSYSAQRLTQVWPSRFPSIAAAEPYARNPEKLAEKVYGGRLGNTQDGDGWRYRGGGLMQITGRANYARIGLLLSLDLVAGPDLLREPETAARAAGAYWSDHDLNALADAGNVEAITRAINGGLNGLSDRIAQVARAKAIWPVSA